MTILAGRPAGISTTVSGCSFAGQSAMSIHGKFRVCRYVKERFASFNKGLCLQNPPVPRASSNIAFIKLDRVYFKDLGSASMTRVKRRPVGHCPPGGHRFPLRQDTLSPPDLRAQVVVLPTPPFAFVIAVKSNRHSTTFFLMRPHHIWNANAHSTGSVGVTHFCTRSTAITPLL